MSVFISRTYSSVLTDAELEIYICRNPPLYFRPTASARVGVAYCNNTMVQCSSELTLPVLDAVFYCQSGEIVGYASEHRGEIIATIFSSFLALASLNGAFSNPSIHIETRSVKLF